MRSCMDAGFSYIHTRCWTTQACTNPVVKEAARRPDTAQPTDKTNCYDPLPGAIKARGTMHNDVHGWGGVRSLRSHPPGRDA